MKIVENLLTYMRVFGLGFYHYCWKWCVFLLRLYIFFMESSTLQGFGVLGFMLSMRGLRAIWSSIWSQFLEKIFPLSWWIINLARSGFFRPRNLHFCPSPMYKLCLVLLTSEKKQDRIEIVTRCTTLHRPRFHISTSELSKLSGSYSTSTGRRKLYWSTHIHPKVKWHCFA